MFVVQVYETLAATVLISAIGAYLHILWGIGGILTGLGSLFASVWIITTPFSPSEEVCIHLSIKLSYSGQYDCYLCISGLIKNM
jgi:hypothetical protein